MRKKKALNIKELKRIEVTKNLYNNIGVLIPRSVLILLLFHLILLITIIISAPYKYNIEAINGKYEYVIESNELYPDYNYCFKFKNILTISNSNGQRINTNTYIEGNKTPNLLISPNINLDLKEISISKKVAQKLGVSVGDTVFVDIPIYDMPVQFIVTDITPYVWDCYDCLNNADFSVSCIAFNSDIINKSDGIFVYFLSENERDTFTENDLSYITLHNISNELIIMRKKLFYCYFIAFLSLGLSIVFLYHLIHGVIIKELGKYQIDCYDIRFINKLYNINHYLYLVVPIIILFITVLICAILGIINISFMLAISSWIIISIMCSNIGGKRFEKANPV